MRSICAYKKVIFILLFIPVLIFIDTGCKKIEIDSAWTDSRIPVDGVRSGDWDGVMYKINDQPVAVGFQNDGDYLYLLLTTYDQGLQRQFYSGGLTIWFDSSGSGRQIFGVHFPLMADQRQLSERPVLNESNREKEGFGLERFPFNVTDMEITRPPEDKKERVNVNQLKEIEAKIGLAEGSLTYELKVPLKNTGPDRYFIGSEAGATISVGIETAERFREHTSQFERRRRDAEELPPALRDDGTAKERRDSPPGTGYNQPMSFWAKVKLALKGS